MSPALTAKYQTFISEMSKQNNENQDIPRVYPLANASLVVHLDPEDLILPDIVDDPVDFIIEFSNECDDLQYIAEKTNEIYNTEYTEDDVQRIIDDFIEAITAE